MVDGIAEANGGLTKLVLRQLLNKWLHPVIMRLLGERIATMEPMFRNTVSPTVIKASQAHNVIPGEIILELDGRMLPGISAEQMESEVRAIVGDDVEIVMPADLIPQPQAPDMSLFPLLAEIIRTHDRTAQPIPYLLPAVTDGRWFATLGIQPYGFVPLALPQNFNFTDYIHAADERVPALAIEFGKQCIFDLLVQYTG